MALDLKLKALNNLRGKADRFCRLIFRGTAIYNNFLLLFSKEFSYVR